MTGCDSSNLSRQMVITSRREEKNTEGGSLFTIAFQILTNASSTAKLTMEFVDSMNSLVSCALRRIKTRLNCKDG
ncbi:homeodomain leucine zipper protein [Medicago truncatula]|uniref:Homeodomain leucine zipper protein n=1 Tax=Medicago truncatula TaxID=3880 RepID=G7IUR5_MEDTR|nr:homeodomain leucine zipper protein [Medicago truncatula]